MVLPDQLVNVFDQGKQARVPLLAGFNSGEIRSLTAARAARARERGGVREHDPRALRRSRRCVPQALPVRQPARRASSRRRATRSTAGPPSGSCASRPRWACRRTSTCGTTAIPPPTRPGCTRSMRASCRTCSARSTARRRSGRRMRTRPRSDALADAMGDYWTSFARTGRPQARNAPDWPAYAPGAQLHALRRDADARARSDARDVRPEREGDVPAPRRRDDAVGLERRSLAAPKTPAGVAGC